MIKIAQISFSVCVLTAFANCANGMELDSWKFEVSKSEIGFISAAKFESDNSLVQISCSSVESSSVLTLSVPRSKLKLENTMSFGEQTFTVIKFKSDNVGTVYPARIGRSLHGNTMNYVFLGFPFWRIFSPESSKGPIVISNDSEVLLSADPMPKGVFEKLTRSCRRIDYVRRLR